MKTLILIDGCRIPDPDQWGAVVWGMSENGLFGRIPLALRIGAHKKDHYLFWGNGASIPGLSGVDRMFFHAILNRASTSMSGYDPYEAEAYLRAVSFFDRDSADYRDTLLQLASVCNERQVSRAVLVSSPGENEKLYEWATMLKGDGLFKGVELQKQTADV